MAAPSLLRDPDDLSQRSTLRTLASSPSSRSCADRMLQNEIMVPRPASALDSDDKKRTVENIDVDSGSNSSDDFRLKQELRIAAEHCQILAEKLCQNDLSPSRKFRIPMSPDRSSSSDDECCREQRLKTKAIVAENIRLRQVLKDVTEVNKRWQKYNTQQQDYIQRLQATIAVLQSDQPPSSLLERAHVPFRLEEDPNKVSLLEHTQTLISLRKSYEKAIKENCRLEKLVKELQTALEKTGHSTFSEIKAKEICRGAELRDAREQAEIHRLQATVHKEDWQAEKADKEEVKRKLAKAEDDIKELTSKCHAYESRLHRIQAATLASIDDRTKVQVTDPCWDFPHNRAPLSVPVEWMYKQSLSPTESVDNFGPQLRVLSRGPSKRGKEDSMSCDVELDLASPPRSLSTSDSMSPRTPPASEHLTYDVLSRHPNTFEFVEDSVSKDIVSCPACLSQFPRDQHLQFLDHFEQCPKMTRTTNKCLVGLN